MKQIQQKLRLLLATVSITIAGSAMSADEDRVIVRFQDYDAPALRDELALLGAEVHYELRSVNAVAMTISVHELSVLQKDSRVEQIEIDAPRIAAPQISGKTAPVLEELSALTNAQPADPGVLCLIDLPQLVSQLRDTDDPHAARVVEKAQVIEIPHQSSASWVYASDLIFAVEQCEARKATVIAFPYGGPQSVQFEREAFSVLRARGISSVNMGHQSGSVQRFPRGYAGVVPARPSN